MKRVSVDLETHLYEWLADYAREGDTNISAVVRFALEELRTDTEKPASEDWWEKWKERQK